ncbi:MAG TPA: HEAT repeat domain-containing protein [Solirubrobacteraceae bacterium]|nr:HEAT repeat domain-containing protein [Solirubrobacteraceae bacterium]
MTIALVAFWIALGAVVLTTALATSLRAFGALTAARRERYRAEISEPLAAFAVGAVDDPPPPPAGRFEQRVLHEELARLAPHLKGDARAQLTGLFERYGLVESVARDLRSEHPLTAIRAAELAGIMHASECVPTLRERLDGDPLVRLACARALAEIGAADAMPQIVAALAESGTATELGHTLMSFGPRAEPVLREQLRSAPTDAQRRIAASTLGEIHAHAAVADLVDALGDRDTELRAAAARALGQIGEQSAGTALVALLVAAGGGRDVACAAAATALGMLDDPAGAAALVIALAAGDWDVRNAAARSLVALGDRGLAEVATRIDGLPSAAIAHFAGMLDVADRLGPVIARAAAGDPAMDRIARAACACGVRSRLRELATGGDEDVSGYANALLHEGSHT